MSFFNSFLTALGKPESYRPAPEVVLRVGDNWLHCTSQSSSCLLLQLGSALSILAGYHSSFKNATVFMSHPLWNLLFFLQDNIIWRGMYNKACACVCVCVPFHNSDQQSHAEEAIHACKHQQQFPLTSVVCVFYLLQNNSWSKMVQLDLKRVWIILCYFSCMC